MDINDNQQINTFMKGMNTDVSDALIDSSQYRYAENLRLVTNTDSNSGELRTVDGTSTVYENFGNILAMTAIRNKLIAIVRESGISIKVSEDKGYSWETIVKNLPYSDFIQTGETEPHFSLVTRWESDNNIKLYIADGVHRVICVNLARRDYIVSGRDNNIEDIAPYMTVPLQAPSINIISGGNIQSARVQYAYRSYNIGEPASTTSPLSNICSIYKTENEGYNKEEYSNKAVNITIPQNVVSFERLQIYRINYVILGQAPSVALIYDGPVINSFTDRGNDVEVSSDTEFLSATQLRIIPKVIESKEDFLFAGNIKYEQDFFDKEVEGLDFRSYSWGDFEGTVPDFIGYTNTRSYNKQFDPSITSDISQFNSMYWMDSDGVSNKCGGTGPIVSWNFSVKDVLVDKDNTIYDYTNNQKGSVIEEDVVSLRRGEVYRYGIILYSDRGTKSSVQWIADIMVPQSVYDSQLNRYAEYPKPVWQDSNMLGWWFTVIGVTFNVNIPQNSNIYGYEIVRCKRSYDDMFTISQGIIGIPVVDADKTSLFSTGIISQENTGGNNFDIDCNYTIYASPECAYQPDDMKDIMKMNKSSLYIKDVTSYYNPLSSTAYNYNDEASYSCTGARQFDTIGVFGNNDHSLFIKSDQAVGRYDECHVRLGERSGHYLETHGFNNTAITHIVAAREVGISQQTSKIQEMSFPDVADPNQFFDTNKTPLWVDSVTPIGGKTFYGWTALPNVSTTKGFPTETYDTYADDEPDRYNHLYYSNIKSPNGAVGKCAIFKLNAERDPVLSQGPQDYVVAPITVSNLKKSAYPYSGPESYKQNGPEYYSHGNYRLKNQNSITVYDGDCFPGVFVYMSEHAFNGELFPIANKSTVVYFVPLESDINLRATCGSVYTRVQSSSKYYYARYLAGEMDQYVQEHDMYLYNTAYGSEPYVISYSNINYTRIDSGTFDTRIHHSDKKSNNEQIDSWGTFKANNYIDVDSRFGEITNMRLFKDKLLYWQKDAFGVASVNERTVVNDVDDNQLVLGTGSTLQRFDYVSTVYGMKKNQYEAEIQSNTTQYFWDGIRKEILAYGGGAELVPLTKIKNVTNYINERGEKNHPSLVYDNKFNELISSVVGTKSLVYNEQIQAFTSTYTFTPIYRAVVDNTVIITDSNSIYHWNADSDNCVLFGNAALPLLRYVVNKNSSLVKVFDISTFGGRVYGGDEGLDNLTFTFDTPLKQHSTGYGRNLITNREYDFRLDIPRNNNDIFGGRMRGKTMQCELKSSSNSNDFSLQYIITKYRMSWS